MSDIQIEVRDLVKHYRVPVRGEGFTAALQSLWKRSYHEVEAVRGVSFDIQAGEVVGFIGPNGAGKTTVLKMLSGLLHPTSGQARVLGFLPWERDSAFLAQISMVLGNKSQMLWDIPALDTFRVLAEIYKVPPIEFKNIVDELVDLLKMEALLEKPVRNLSLGERMKCELVAGLLYRPKVMFLDEPTLGLDVSMQSRLRKFLADYNQRRGVTMMLTSHYMADVTALCPRVILIHHGKLLYDGELAGLATKLAPFKLINLTLRSASANEFAAEKLPQGAELIERDNNHISLRVARDTAAEVTAAMLNTLRIADLSVEDPPIEAVIDQVYQGADLVEVAA